MKTGVQLRVGSAIGLYDGSPVYLRKIHTVSTGAFGATPMTIEDLKGKQEDMRKRIQGLIAAFEKETGLTVSSVNLHHASFAARSNPMAREKVLEAVTITTELSV